MMYFKKPYIWYLSPECLPTSNKIVNTPLYVCKITILKNFLQDWTTWGSDFLSKYWITRHIFMSSSRKVLLLTFNSLLRVKQYTGIRIKAGMNHGETQSCQTPSYYRWERWPIRWDYFPKATSLASALLLTDLMVDSSWNLCQRWQWFKQVWELYEIELLVKNFILSWTISLHLCHSHAMVNIMVFGLEFYGPTTRITLAVFYSLEYYQMCYLESLNFLIEWWHRHRASGIQSWLHNGISWED